MPSWLSLLLGLILGASLACVATAMCVAAHRGDAALRDELDGAQGDAGG